MLLKAAASGLPPVSAGGHNRSVMEGKHREVRRAGTGQPRPIGWPRGARLTGGRLTCFLPLAYPGSQDLHGRDRSLDILRSASRMYIHIRIYIMNLQVAKWGNSLALRIPSEVVQRLGLREGATLEAQITVDGGLSIRPARWDRKAFALELNEARRAMPVSESVMDELRSGARY